MGCCWSPDAIWFDNTSSYGTPSYYVQRLFGQNAGDTVVPTTLEAATTPLPDIRGGIGVATWRSQRRSRASGHMSLLR